MAGSAILPLTVSQAAFARAMSATSRASRSSNLGSFSSCAAMWAHPWRNAGTKPLAVPATMIGAMSSGVSVAEHNPNG
jgi:hypothetical protein